MTASAAHQRAVCDAIAAMGAKMKLYNGDPLATPTPGTAIASTPAIVTLTWGAAVDGAGGDAGKAVATSSAGNFVLPAGSNATHYGIFAADGTTLLRSRPMDSAITVGAAAISVDVVAKTKYQGGQ